METSLLRTIRPEALYDRVYELRGEVEVFSLMNNLARALEERVTLLSIVSAETENNAELCLHVGVKYEPDLYWKPLSLGGLDCSLILTTSHFLPSQVPQPTAARPPAGGSSGGSGVSCGGSSLGR